MRHPSTRALFTYWNELRGSRIAPRRLELQPARLGGLLLDSFILEIVDGDQYRFRLAGTRISSRFATSLRAADFLGCWKESDRGLIAYHLKAATDFGRVTLYTGETETTAFELIVLPLVHSGNAIDRLLCHLVPLEESAAGTGSRITGLKLAAAETLASNGEPLVTVDSGFGRQLALHPRVRTARIVRQGTRQFRVYEGGLVAAGETKR